jgi:membrane protease YdiL (CAAX protease family)
MVLTGFIFSLVHFQFEGFLPRWIMGVFLGFLAYRTQSLWPSILAHFVNNLSGILFFYQFDGSMKTPEDHWLSSPIWWGVSVLGMIGVIYWLGKNTRERGWLG